MQSRSDEDTAAAESGPSPCQMSTSESNGKNARRLLQSYEPLPYHLIDEEIVILEGVYESMSRLWEEECQKYEETMEVRVDDKKLTVPRRNYLNEKGTVEDDSLFPYHTACYPLLDAYDCIYEEDQSQQPISSKAFRRHPFVTPQERHPEEITDVQGFMPCSVKAIIESLVMDRYFLGGFWRWMDALVRQHKCLCSLGSFPAENTLIEFDALQFSNDAEGWRTFVTERMSLETSAPYGPLHLPRERKDRATILLKLVRHSLSELQRDYRVAAAAMVLLMILHDLEDILVFRQLLVVIESEFVGCGNPCDHEILDMNHFCSDWSQLHLVIKMVICDGVSFFTHEHAICLAGFVRSIYLREFGSLALDPAEESVTGKRKRILKRTVVARRALEDDEDDEGREDSTGKIPAQLVELLVSCLGERGIFERKRLLKLRNDYAKYDVIPKDIICQFVSSYYNCVRVLVSVAELTVQLLPESERFYPIASCLVSSLFRSISLHEVDVGENARYFGLNCPTLRDIRLISPLRYADSITDAMGRKRVRFAGRSAAPLEVDPSTSFLLEKFESQFEQEPPNDVLTAVQGLYLRNLVDVRYAGLGYGDFLMWCRYEITPLDPILFWNEYAYPVEEDVDDEDDEDEDEVEEEDRPVHWDEDEDEHGLSNGEIRARYDFTLMLLLRAWQAPWSPTTHASFQPDFRNAAKAVALCTHKLGFPHEIVSGICSFLNRDWWDDSRKQCWSYDCRSEMNFKILSPKKSEQCTSDTKTEALEYCPNCRVALYCSKNCREKDYKETHKKRCCRPPFRTTLPDYEELQLCVEILQTGDTSLPQFLTARSTAAIDNVRQASMFPSSTNQSIGDENVDDDSDAGSWETVGSDEGADDTEMSPITKTTRIYKYFKETAYKPKI